MAVKMNLRIITKNHAAAPEIGFLTKSISNPNGCTTARPSAWELRRVVMTHDELCRSIFGTIIKYDHFLS